MAIRRPRNNTKRLRHGDVIPKLDRRTPRREKGCYPSDLAYIDDELKWLQARCERITWERKLRDFQQQDSDELEHGLENAHANLSLANIKLREAARREKTARKRIDKRLRSHAKNNAPLAFHTLADHYGLDAFERTVLLLAAAPCFSSKFADLYGGVNESSFGTELNIEVIFNFCELTFVQRIERRAAFMPSARLASNDLVNIQLDRRYSDPKDLLDTGVTITSRTFAAILGNNDLPHEFLEFSRLEMPLAVLDHVVAPSDDKRRILSVVDRHEQWLQCRNTWGFDERITYGKGALMLFYGPPGTGKTMTAHAVAAHLGKKVLNVDIPAFLRARESDRFLPSLFREARLQDAVLFFDECEVIFGDRRGGNVVMTMLLTELERYEGVAILATNMPGALDEALDRRLLVKVRFSPPDRQARAAIWQHHLPQQAPIADDVDIEVLADRYELTGGLIKNATLMAVAAAVHESEDPAAAQITMRLLERAARDQLIRPRDDDSEMVYPQTELRHVVLSPKLREEVADLVGAARNSKTVLRRWGIGQHLLRGKGTVALLSGPPGTGKTLTAEAIANELGRPLYAVGASTILSKWVGDTERRLETMFRTCREHNAVLFMDECDGLLGVRDGQRNGEHSVSRVNTLLRLIERHDGVIVLATNRFEALDPALVRRLSHHLRFSLPDVAARESIWRGLLPDTVPLQEKLDIPGLSRRFPLSGAAIANAVFQAAYRAAADQRGLTMQDLERAAAEESPADVGNEVLALMAAAIEA